MPFHETFPGLVRKQIPLCAQESCVLEQLPMGTPADVYLPLWLKAGDSDTQWGFYSSSDLDRGPE